MDRREDAETLYLRATEILQDRPDAGLRGLGQILSNLGRLYLSSGHNEQAEKTLKRAYDVSARTRSPKHHEIATALNFLALTKIRTGRYDEAISDLRQGLVIREESLGKDHPHTGITRTRLGEALYEKGQPREAEEYVRRGIGILQTQLGKDYPETAAAVRQLGSILVDRGELTEGFRMLEAAAATHTKLEAFNFAQFASLDQISAGKVFPERPICTTQLNRLVTSTAEKVSDPTIGIQSRRGLIELRFCGFLPSAPHQQCSSGLSQ
jgi:tetratricopeptide (TPR) repeat protein